ncbi:uncharacterized protein STAUR_0459 [Stigmatella aurantiaca DW4/3-1]|uniref:Cytochrome c domain-containing protein n=1 Tax=Stigmatella aurantiaca (strain DW4/3-1) TaxID=378806 RepID=E3FRT3_STIAD|nr:uncharacterized protein STAUR_0459 [Stigmatella aurantiaca DW4/3-1]
MCVLAVLVSVSSGLWVLRARAAQPRREVEQGGLRLRVEQATWLHEPMDHGDAVQLPALQGAPGAGQRQLAVSLTLFNAAQGSGSFAARELVLTAENGQQWFPVEREEARLWVRPAQLFPLPLSFNVPASAGGLRLEWVRGEERAVLLSTRPPPSATSQAGGRERWPQSAEALPSGSPRAGAVLFHERFACVTCHGSPERPGEVRVAPSLHGFAKAGAARLPGMSAAQYAYESLLFPGAFIAPGCAGDAPCQAPSLMPVYGDALSSQEMADLISYLLGAGRGRP